MSQQNMIAFAKGLNKSFSGKPAVVDLDLEIQAGQVLAILGANGAGKTTLINILLGRLSHDSGDVNLFNAKAGSLEAKRLIGAMLQVANLPETLKIKEHIRLFQSYYPNPMPYEKVLAYAGLEKMQNRYSKKLSGGEKQRLLFALSICGNPKLLFLDEPSVGMDMESRQSMWQAIRDLKRAGTSIVLTTHYLQEADSLADEILLLKDGKVVKRGSSEEIKASVNHTTIRFCADLDPAVFEGFEGVVSCSKSGKYIEVQTSNASQSLQQILAQYPDLEDVTVERAGLEEAFKQLNQ
ncbi:ABC transporter ATP-binding protein [Paraglaciecola sp. 2405UD69-4]|uniref:ABC transporter ATP-binding protein n=1 Tax=Paraglaciecola sp. 2405UD69-4 TaxID=3391836 RepID=UPI0039C8C3E3